MNKVEILKRKVQVYGHERTLAVIGIQRDDIEDPDGYCNYPKDMKTAPGWILNSKLISSEEDFKKVEEFAEMIKNANIEFKAHCYGYDWLINSININDETDYCQYTWVENDFKLHSLQETVDEMIECGCAFFDEKL